MKPPNDSGANLSPKRRGRPKAEVECPTAAIARDGRCSQRAVQRRLARAERIAPDVKDVIGPLRAVSDSGVELDFLASRTPEVQRMLAAMVARGEARDTREAAALSGYRVDVVVQARVRAEVADALGLLAAVWTTEDGWKWSRGQVIAELLDRALAGEVEL